MSKSKILEEIKESGKYETMRDRAKYVAETFVADECDLNNNDQVVDFLRLDGPDFFDTMDEVNRIFVNEIFAYLKSKGYKYSR